MTYQVEDTLTTDGTIGVINISAPPPPSIGASPELVIATLADVPDAAPAGRIAASYDLGDEEIDIRPPAKAGGLFIAYGARWWHSLPKPILSRWFTAHVAVPPASTILVNHNLGALPDWMVAQPTTINDGTDWAVISLDANTLEIKNWDPVNQVDIRLVLWLLHSLNKPVNSLGACDTGVVVPVSLPIGAPLDMTHDFGRPAGPISLIPWSAGGVVQPQGYPYIAAPGTDVAITVANIDATAPFDLLVFMQATHSVQL